MEFVVLVSDTGSLRYEFESRVQLASAERLPTPDLACPATVRSILFSDTSNLHTSIHVLTYVLSVVRWNILLSQ
jgi:hypothetical protein